MECRQATDLLPLFMDDALDQGARRSLQEHLDACPQCRGELDKLQSLAQDLRAHGMMKAPDDFLEKLHARTRESRLKDLFRLLFYPLHVKIPVEVVGLASVAMIIFSLFHAVEPEVRMTAPQGVSSDAGSVREQVSPQEFGSEPLPREAAPVTEKDTAKTPHKQAVRPYGKKQEAVPAKIGQAEVKTPLQQIDVYIVMRGIEKLQAEKPAEAEDQELRRQDEESAKSPGSQVKPRALTVSPERRALSSLNDIITSVQGSLIGVDYDELSREPRVVTARIPAGMLDEFFRRIRGVAELETPAPSALQPCDRDCLVRIHLAPEETLQK